MKYWLKNHRNLALFIANVLGAMVYLPLALIGWTRLTRRVTPEPLFRSLSAGVLLLFIVVNLAWGIVVLASPRPRRWDYFGLVWGVWIVAVILGSGLASI